MVLFLWKKTPTRPWLDWDTGFLLKMQQIAFDVTHLFYLWCLRGRSLTLKTVSSFYSPRIALEYNSLDSKWCWRNIPLDTLSTCRQDQTHPQHRPREILIASGQETGGQPYFSQERAVPLWASPAVLETKQPMEREMDSCSHEGVNLCLPTIITTPMTWEKIQRKDEG